ncbi:Rxlr-like protein, partial [Globisporangium splendens]
MKMMGVTMGLALFCNTFLNNDNYTHVLIVRGLYALSQIFVYSTLLLIYTRAKKNTEPGVITVKEDIGFGQEGEKDEKITVSEYDMRQTMNEVQKIAIGTAITIFIHWKWGFFPPLFIQTVTQPYNLFQSPLAKVTLLGQKAWGELRRPWQNPMAMGTQWNKWNDTIQSALGGEPVVRQSKKAAKKAAGKRKSK